MRREGGRYRFLAPELLDGPQDLRPTKSSDIYSLSLTFFNLATLETPFSQYHRDISASNAALRGERPKEPPELPFFTPDRFESLFGLLKEMWSHDPLVCPDAATVADRLQEILAPVLSCAADWRK